MYRPAFSIQLWGQTIQLKLCLFVLKYHVISTFIELLEAIIFISPLNEIVVGVHEQAVVRIQCTNGQLMDPLTGAVLLLWPMSVRYCLGRISPYKNLDTVAFCMSGAKTNFQRPPHLHNMVHGTVVNIGNGYELNNNKGKLTEIYRQCTAWKRRSGEFKKCGHRLQNVLSKVYY